MPKVLWKPGTMIFPVPALLISCGTPEDGFNIITIAWTGTVCSEPPMCYISVRPERYSHAIISKQKEFVINLTTERLARATDWMVDPETGQPLPEDCFKFTGSLRIEHPDTGEEMLLGERSGRLISVWPDRSALVEVALKSAVKNNYQYNWSRLPKQEGSGPFYVDLIFSKTPMKK